MSNDLRAAALEIIQGEVIERSEVTTVRKMLPDSWRAMAQAYLDEHPPVGGRRDMNIVLGVATGLMTALGMQWKDEVAMLCNFGDFDEAKRRWETAGAKAHELLRALLPPADDGEAVDEAWLRSVGFAAANERFEMYVGHELTICVSVELFGPGDNRVEVEDQRAIIDANRGDVRRLCAALGITLKASVPHA